MTETAEINLAEDGTAVLFSLKNGAENGESKVTSCFVVVNADTIVYPIEMSSTVDVIEKETVLPQNSQMSVRVLGKPGSFVTITITAISDPEIPCAVTDIDGNVYKTVKIGDQCWMAENLKVAHYRDGSEIPIVTDADAWAELSTGARCAYDNNEENAGAYGYLYNWHAVNDSRHIAPSGWHVPSDADWKQLEMYLGMSQSQADATGWRGTDEGGKMKEAGTVHWSSPNTGATNESGMSALPGGYRYLDGYYYDLGRYAYFWSSTEYSSIYAWNRTLRYDRSDVCYAFSNKPNGYSVRCVRD